ncbi:hypothetical protein PYW07_004343 [Mythimna separata]|uniref:C2H2-type domain-containing protein n=1 Tax=Mythimna separata TaxID=271217 RepID=A0AAD7YVU1_MYTSE|nr:hypothetical protein PYW07_004343 [Mythimna separata]
MLRHLRTSHTHARHPCPICDKTLTSPAGLRHHVMTHSNMKTIRRYMLRHLRTSHTHARHPCPICDKTLTSPAGLRHHVMTHSNMKTIRCKMCPKAYSVKRTMIKHFRRRHGFKGTEPNIKEFYTRLDPRECNLGLDETTMTSIFGPPPKKSTDEILVADYVTVANIAPLQPQEEDKEESQTTEDTQSTQDTLIGKSLSSQSQSEDEKEAEEPEDRKIVIKIEAKDPSEPSNSKVVEPTDFVSVKIEPMDEHAEES